MNYYNDIDAHAVAWLRNLIREGLIPAGEVDDCPIQEINADDLKEFTQCHFFAGIAGWSYALALAEWPEDRPVWTGSCPCQPFSSAGGQAGEKDERHLWPAFHALIAERNPSIIFGEQVASKLGREWLAAVRLDLEELGFAVGAADLCAAGVGAPHIRQRLFWVADGNDADRRPKETRDNFEEFEKESESTSDSTGSGQASIWVADIKSHKQRKRSDRNFYKSGSGVGNSKANKEGKNQPASRLGDASSELGKGGSKKQGRGKQEQPGRTGAWSGIKFVRCADNKARPVKPGILPLADGVPGRVGKIHAYGNAIVPQVAAVFIKSFMEAVNIPTGVK